MDLKERADRFLTIFQGECLHRRQELDFAQMMSYFEVLKTLPPTAIEAAAMRLRKTCEFFPSSAEWHRLAVAFSIDAAEDEPPPVAKGEYWCQTCRDSGFRPVEPPSESRVAGLAGWRTFCECRATNPVLKQQRDVAARLRGA